MKTKRATQEERRDELPYIAGRLKKMKPEKNMWV